MEAVAAAAAADPALRVAILEIGCGARVPTVRTLTQALVLQVREFSVHHLTTTLALLGYWFGLWLSKHTESILKTLQNGRSPLLAPMGVRSCRAAPLRSCV